MNDIAYHLADAAAALRVASDKFASAFDASTGQIESVDLLAARHTAGIFARLLGESPLIAESPRIAPRVFVSIARYRNRTRGNSPHVEGAVIALALAARSLESALELAGQLDGGDIDPDFVIAFAAMESALSFEAIIGQSALVFGKDAVFERLVRQTVAV